MIRKIITALLCLSFSCQQAGFAQVALDTVRIPAGSPSFDADTFRPAHLRYLTYDGFSPTVDVQFDNGDAQATDARASGLQVLKYFLTGLALPDDSFWVNLRPDSPGEMIDDNLALTDLGKILLEADLQLKKDTAAHTSPKTREGREYWDKLYKKTEELFGQQTPDIPTLCRPWIVPGEIIVRDTGGSAYIYKATLKVMLEQDYLKGTAAYEFKDDRLRQLNEYSGQLMRELIIPQMTREINSCRRYAALRQVYYSLILAAWFKEKFKGGAGEYAAMIDTKNLDNLVSRLPWKKEEYYDAYTRSFRQGEYRLQETVTSVSGQATRSYFSGGISLPLSGKTLANGGIRQRMQKLVCSLKNDFVPLKSTRWKVFLTKGGLRLEEAVRGRTSTGKAKPALTDGGTAASQRYLDDIDLAKQQGIIQGGRLSEGLQVQALKYSHLPSSNAQTGLGELNTRELSGTGTRLLKMILGREGPEPVRAMELGPGAGRALANMKDLADEARREIKIEVVSLIPVATKFMLNASWRELSAAARQAQRDWKRISLDSALELRVQGEPVFKELSAPFIEKEYIDQFWNVNPGTTFDIIYDSFGDFFYSIRQKNGLQRSLDKVFSWMNAESIFLCDAVSTEPQHRLVSEATIPGDMVGIISTEDAGLIVVHKQGSYYKKLSTYLSPAIRAGKKENLYVVDSFKGVTDILNGERGELSCQTMMDWQFRDRVIAALNNRQLADKVREYASDFPVYFSKQAQRNELDALCFQILAEGLNKDKAGGPGAQDGGQDFEAPDSFPGAVTVEDYKKDIEDAVDKNLITYYGSRAAYSADSFSHLSWEERNAGLSSWNTRGLSKNGRMLLTAILQDKNNGVAARAIDLGAGAGKACADMYDLAKLQKKELRIETISLVPVAPRFMLRASWQELFAAASAAHRDVSAIALDFSFGLQKSGMRVFEISQEPYIQREYIGEFLDERIQPGTFDFILDSYGGFHYSSVRQNGLQPSLDKVFSLMGTDSIFLCDYDHFWAAISRLAVIPLGMVGVRSDVDNSLIFLNKQGRPYKKISGYLERLPPLSGGKKNFYVADFDELIGILLETGRGLYDEGERADTSAPGGIDLRGIPGKTKKIVDASGTSRIYAADASLDLDKELQRIEKMVSGGLQPSVQRLGEFAAACRIKEETAGYTEALLTCIAGILRMEETKAQPTEQELRELLVSLEENPV
jgi:hypothetical protein